MLTLSYPPQSPGCRPVVLKLRQAWAHQGDGWYAFALVLWPFHGLVSRLEMIPLEDPVLLLLIRSWLPFLLGHPCLLQLLPEWFNRPLFQLCSRHSVPGALYCSDCPLSSPQLPGLLSLRTNRLRPHNHNLHLQVLHSQALPITETCCRTLSHSC